MQTESSRPTPTRISRTAWLTWALYIIVLIGGGRLILTSLGAPGLLGSLTDVLFTILDHLFGIVFGVMGALILRRHPRHVIGWLLMEVFALTAFIGPALDILAQSISDPPVPTFITLLYFWINEWIWWLLIAPLLLTMLFFPTGRLLSPRWRWVIVILVSIFGSFLFFATFSPTISDPASSRSLPNPLALIPETFPIALFMVPFSVSLVTTVALCVTSVFIRYRRAAGSERAQIKWLLLAGAFFLITYGGRFLVNDGGQANIIGILSYLGYLAIPAAIGIAILRYRLWDIDVIIRRTLQYAILTGLLSLVYFGGVALLQATLSAVGSQSSPVVIVATTFAIAALFNPLRRRIQGFIDRRFYQRKYDAERALAQFAVAARSETELGLLSAKMVQVADEALQPQFSELWLAPTKGESAERSSP